jgi:hypothetical protein
MAEDKKIMVSSMGGAPRGDMALLPPRLPQYIKDLWFENPHGTMYVSRRSNSVDLQARRMQDNVLRSRHSAGSERYQE